MGRLTNLQHKDGNNNGLANYTYSYDLASRLTQEQDNGTTTNYGYDATNQLTSAGGTNYSYDLNGNRTMTGYVTGTENQITTDGVWTYTYDAEGNVTQKSKGSSAETWTFGYDNLNQMIWAQDRSAPGGTLTLAATYTYDVFGNRLEKDVWQTGGSTTTTRFAYDGQDVWADLTSSNALQTRYIRGDVVDQIFARVSSGGTAAWYLTDRQGSVRNLTDAGGTLQDTITYDGFGNATESSSSFGDRYKYTAREFDSETGFQYNRARYYTAAIGRWTSQDPIGFDAGDKNLYRYVGNDPTNLADPNGLKPKKVTIVKTQGKDPLTGQDGAYAWPVRFVLDSGATGGKKPDDYGGYVIQEVKADLTVDYADPKLIPEGTEIWWDGRSMFSIGKPVHYLEVWPVQKGQTIPIYASNPRVKQLLTRLKKTVPDLDNQKNDFNDLFWSDGYPGSIRGSLTVDAKVYYIDRLTGKKVNELLFHPGDQGGAREAGYLFSRYLTDKQSIFDIFKKEDFDVIGPWPHTLKVKWECKKGQKHAPTEIVEHTP